MHKMIISVHIYSRHLPEVYKMAPNLYVNCCSYCTSGFVAVHKQQLTFPVQPPIPSTVTQVTWICRVCPSHSASEIQFIW